MRPPLPPTALWPAAPWLAALLCLGCAGDPPPPPAARASVRPPDPAALHVGGSGALTPLFIRLGEAWARAGGAPRVVVEESIGSGGGVRAAADGAVDLGLLSRPLTAEEQRLGLSLIPMGRDAVVIAAHPAIPVDGIAAADLVALARGAARRFPDGSPAVLLLRDRSESANGALEQAVPGLQAAREEAYRSHRLRVLYHDRAMAEALLATPGAIGVFPLGAILGLRLPLKVLALDGVTPAVEALADGRWRPSRRLWIVARADRLARAAPFLSFLASPVARDLSRACGYLPPGPEAAP